MSVAAAERLRTASDENIPFWHEAFGSSAFSCGFQVVRNKALAAPEMGIQKVAAHETFAEFLRLYL